jgi:hypothetical protein
MVAVLGAFLGVWGGVELGRGNKNPATARHGAAFWRFRGVQTPFLGGLIPKKLVSGLIWLCGLISEALNQ